MEVLASADHAEFVTKFSSDCASNIEKLPSENIETKHGNYCNKTPDNIESNERSWVDATRPCSNGFSAEEAVGNEGSFERDQNQIQYLLTKLPLLAEKFNIHRKVGEGTFSSVFLGTLKNTNSSNSNIVRKFAIKHLVPTTLPARTQRELQCLQDIGGLDNVIGIDLCLRQDDCIVFIMPYLPHKRFSDYVQEMSVTETRDYMRNLFIALRRVHSFNIIHRDIKPSNFLYDRESKRFLLVDFGLAQCVTSESTSQIKKRRREEDENATNTSKCTPDFKKIKRMALQPRTNENNIVNINRNDTSLSHNSADIRASTKNCSAENEHHRMGLSPYRTKVLGVKNENTPPESRKTPRCRPLQNDGNRSPLKDNHTKHSAIKKKLFPAVPSSKTHLGGPKFQTLVPNTPNGTSFVRVQNSQVKTHAQSSQHKQKVLVFSKPSPVTPVTSKHRCHCYGKSQVCTLCMSYKVHAAPRAGTPGFRPPEVLLKYPLQTTAVDMWAAGVVLLCILSGCYPFFRSPDDLSALAEIMSVFGTESIKKLGARLGRMVTCSVDKKALNLRKLCERLRRHRKDGRPSVAPETPVCSDCTQVIDKLNGCLCLSADDTSESSQPANNSEEEYPRSAYHLLERLLDLNPETRITASEALEHPFVKGL